MPANTILSIAEGFKHHFCPKCRRRFYSSAVKGGMCPQCGYNIFAGWSLPTAAGFQRGVESHKVT